jgi:signal transduction histidine kinase
MASRITANARRMSALIDDVADFARGRLGSGIGVNIRDVDDLAAALTAVVRELQDASPDRRIDTDIGILGRVQCDKARVQQMASNLVANALTHGSAQHPIRVTARAVEGYVTFSVSNEGEPIPESSIDKVFQPFWRHSISNSREGLGLGLYICSQIVRAHAGVLSVTSTRENGTVFKARLPVRRPIDATPPADSETL